MSAWSGWDPETYQPPPCPVCGATLEIDWVERPMDPELQTPAEMVERRVADLDKDDRP